MEEVWKSILGYEGMYEISNLGRIRSLDRYVQYPRYKCFVKGRIIKPCVCKNGYYEAHLHMNGKRKAYLLHRLVASAFIHNPDNLPEVNHKDENPSNNCADNLEWCTSKYNANYGTRNERCFHKYQQKPINQLSLNGEFIKRWNGIGEAAKSLGIDDSHIIRVCQKKKRSISAGGYKWEYAT